MRDVAAALRYLKGQHSDPRRAGWFNRCLELARTAYGLDGRYPEADIAWSHTKFRTEPQAKPPAGWLCWWDRPGNPLHDADAGHVAVSAGEGLCWSNDARRRGGVDLVRISDITRAWGLKYVGNSRDINGVVVVPKDTRVPPSTGPRPRLITVKAGDTVSGLVARYQHGEHDWSDVWRDPHNDGLRKRRGKPELIQPGDRLWVP